MTVSSPLLHISPGPPHHQFCNKLSAPVYPAGGTYTTPPPRAVREKFEGFRQRSSGAAFCAESLSIANGLSPHIPAHPVCPLRAE